jgi:NAD(P)-dependent dehydrogenase (short-subunit alcohol dehydrogenase family)
LVTLEELIGGEIAMNIELKGKVALVTGSGKGIGKAIARAFGDAGAVVAVNAAHLESAQSTVDEMKMNGNEAIAIEADVADEKAVSSMIDRVTKELGGLDILVNNAGIGSEMVPTIEQSIERFDRIVAVHLRGTYLCCRSAGRWMVKNKSGKVVNIGSAAGMGGMPRRTAYGAAKAGIIQLTRVLAVEWAEYGINVNCISPGLVFTPLIERGIQAGIVDLERMRKRHPLKRLGKPEEIADAALFLVSDHAAWITGVNLPVDGGWAAYGDV